MGLMNEVPKEHIYIGHRLVDGVEVENEGWWKQDLEVCMNERGHVYKSAIVNMRGAWRHYSRLGYNPGETLNIIRHVHTNYPNLIHTRDDPKKVRKQFLDFINGCNARSHISRVELKRWNKNKKKAIRQVERHGSTWKARKEIDEMTTFTQEETVTLTKDQYNALVGKVYHKEQRCQMLKLTLDRQDKEISEMRQELAAKDVKPKNVEIKDKIINDSQNYIQQLHKEKREMHKKLTSMTKMWNDSQEYIKVLWKENCELKQEKLKAKMEEKDVA